MVCSFSRYIRDNFSKVIEKALWDYSESHWDLFYSQFIVAPYYTDFEYEGFSIENIFPFQSFGTSVDFDVYATIRYSALGNRRYPRDFFSVNVTLSCDGDLAKDLQDFHICKIELSGDKPTSKDSILTDELIPIIPINEYDNKAEQILRAYYPKALEYPVRIDAEYFANSLGLRVKKDLRLSSDQSVFGLIFFKNGYFDVYPEKNASKSVREYFSAGTILIDPDVMASRPEEAVHYAIVHECVHWCLHRKLFEFLRIINGSDSVIEYYSSGAIKFSADIKAKPYLEKQAESITPRILAPKVMVDRKVEGDFRIFDGKLAWASNAQRASTIIETIHAHFGLSKESAKYRLFECGYDIVAGVLNFANGQKVQDFSFKSGSLERNETYCIDFPDLIACAYEEPDLDKLIQEKKLIYIDSHLCINSPDYVFEDCHGFRELTEYALNHADECFVKFRITLDYSTESQGINGFTLYRESKGKRKSKCCLISEETLRSFESATANIERAFYNDDSASKLLTSNGHKSLEAFIKEAGYTQLSLGIEIGVSERTIRRYCDDKIPSLPTLIAICVVLRIPATTNYELLSKFRYTVTDRSKQCHYYRWILDNINSHSLLEWNAILLNANLEPLTACKAKAV